MKLLTKLFTCITDLCIPKCFEYFVLTNSYGLEKTKCLLLDFKYSVLYEQLRNPKATHSFKEPNLVGIIK